MRVRKRTHGSALRLGQLGIEDCNKLALHRQAGDGRWDGTCRIR
jgi:hypothetical protein